MNALFQSPKNRAFILQAFKALILLTLINHSAHLSNIHLSLQIGIWTCLFALGANEYFRGRHWLLVSKSQPFFLISITISMVLLGIVNVMMSDSGGQEYIQLVLIELLIFSRKISYELIFLNWVGYVLPDVLAHSQIYIIGNISLNYLACAIVGILFRTIVQEKVKVVRLYEELQTANEKLEMYSEAVEELTITKERARIAQELHDSIGHTLVALSMNLEFAHQKADTDPDTTKQVLAKTLTISKDGLSELRKAVHSMNQPFTVENLQRSLRELFANFDQIHKLTLRIEIDDAVEEESLNVKECLYKTVREAITNGIRHGGANLFEIHIHKSETGTSMLIQNNGKKCGPLVKSRGLLGMEDRVAFLGGKMTFRFEQGFAIHVQLPA